MTDQDLLLRIQARDESAIALLYDRYSKLIYGFLLGMLKDTDEAEDVTQEVFVLVWTKAASYDAALGNPKNWIVRIAHNRAVNVLRSKRIRSRQVEIAIPDENAAEGRSIVAELAEDTLWDSTVQNEERTHIDKALTILPREQRQLIDLAFFQGFSHSEIAEQLSLPLGTVKTRIRSGLRTLRSQLGHLHEEFGRLDQ